MSDNIAIGIADREYRSGGAVDTHSGSIPIKKHIDFQGLKISIENPKGSVRRGTDDQGKPWANRMAADYGYIKRTEDKDGDQIDVFVGPNKNSNRVFIIDQVHEHTKDFDEHKCMLGFATEAQALSAYHRSYGRGSRQRVGGVSELPLSEFAEWVKRGGGQWPLAPFVGAYILPHDIPKILGGGDERSGHEIAAAMFGSHDALGASAVHPAVVKDLGDGDLATGHAVIEKFIDLIRKQHSAEGDEYHGAAKATKAAANYRDQGTATQHCAICTMFEPSDNSCTLVEGKIAPQGWCRYFEPKR